MQIIKKRQSRNRKRKCAKRAIKYNPHRSFQGRTWEGPNSRLYNAVMTKI